MPKSDFVALANPFIAVNIAQLIINQIYNLHEELLTSLVTRPNIHKPFLEGISFLFGGCAESLYGLPSPE